jgi:light-regulated signal transduction histidine kinase (bacteriophytochrome)
MQPGTESSTEIGVRPRRPELASQTAEDCVIRLNADSLHDLASPMSQMRAIAEMILKKYQGTFDADADVMFGFLKNSAERLENLLTGMRTYMRVVGTRESYRRSDGNALLEGALAMVRRAIDQNTAAVTYEQLPELYCDPTQISCVFANLIENAVKFRSEHRPEVDISVAKEENFWVFSVRDNGIGIDPRHSQQIFAIFKRIHNTAYPGAGVGLAITKQIVEQHGGRIWVESRLGTGTAFHFTLPRD